jgi:hypothetical protein
MKTTMLLLGTLAMAVPVTASAAPSKTKYNPRPASAPKGKEAGARAVGTHIVPHANQPMHATNNPPHQVVYHNEVTKKDEHHSVVVETRPSHVIAHDPRMRIIRRGYKSPHNWAHFHYARGGWWHAWGITTWDTVGVVTCEAANETTGEMYPVSMDRDDTGWDDDTVNSVLDQALDDCMSEAGTAQCAPATPACSFQNQ